MAQITKAIVKVGDIVVLVRPFKIYRDTVEGGFDICDENGNCLSAKQEELFLSTLNKQSNMKAMKDAVLKVAQGLAKANNTVTTLEIKNELRRDYPYYFWTQDIVSNYMDQLAGDGVFTYTDNGTYRIYSLVSTKPNKSKAYTFKGLTKTVIAGRKTANTVSASQTATGLKVQKTKIDWQRLLNLATNPQFAAVTLANGTTVSKNDIKNQKKSPTGYITPKLGRIKSIVVGNKQYNVI